MGGLWEGEGGLISTLTLTLTLTICYWDKTRKGRSVRSALGSVGSVGSEGQRGWPVLLARV